MVWTPSMTLLVLLFAGHAIADFVVQTESIAVRKERQMSAMVLHGVATLVTHIVVAAPLLTTQLLVGLIALGVVHTVTDIVRRAIVRDIPERAFPGLVVDQTVHGFAILILWWFVAGRSGSAQPADWVPCGAGGALAMYGRVAAVAGGLALNWKGGTAVVRRLLARYPEVVPEDAGDRRHQYAMGRTIGCLERTLVFSLVLFGQWGALGFVIAAKSIARFKELDDKHFADYYLIGTLASMLVAVGTGILVRYLLAG
jgi:hypothetical protein